MAISEVTCDEDRVYETLRLADTGQKEKALEFINLILKENPTDIPALYAKTYVLLGTQETQEILRVCAKIKELINPLNYANEKYSIPRGFIYSIEATAHMQAESIKPAMKAIQTAIKINKIVPFVLMRAIIYIEAFKFEKAHLDLTFVQEHPYQGSLFGWHDGELEDLAKYYLQRVNAILQHPNYSKELIEKEFGVNSQDI